MHALIQVSIGKKNAQSDTRARTIGHVYIILDYGVVVFPRKGYHRGHAKARLMKENPNYKICLLKAPNIVISSTRIRTGMAAGEDMSKWMM